jgi:hypothetical protein
MICATEGCNTMRANLIGYSDKPFLSNYCSQCAWQELVKWKRKVMDSVFNEPSAKFERACIEGNSGA